MTEVDGIPVTTPARTIVDVARSSPFTGAGCAADEALRRNLCSSGDLASELEAAAGRVGIARARAVVAFEEALRIDPEYSMARLLAEVVQAGVHPGLWDAPSLTA